MFPASPEHKGIDVATILLIHGGWSGSWVWDRLKLELESLNIASMAIDLPGHEPDRSGFLWNVSLDDYTDRLIQAAESIEGPVIAVAHSMGGLPMTAAASQAPQTFNQLVYLSAFAPVTGERFLNLAQGDKESVFASGVRPNPLLGAVNLKDSVRHDALFHDCSEADEQYCRSRLAGNPLRPALRKLKLTDNLASIPKRYILCSDDRALTPAYQRWMADRSGISVERELDSGHMPMFSMPGQLAQVLADYSSNP